ncbi:DinB family protein [Dyadobacter fanqingshengii]|uniref:DinB family protein n=1 Tax=Dyadobacter fanqingshengii TaxID=2906443 RepID=A0A9X1PD64_9BACT|nr:DinB family protein [Dyadobacter fanqingshengii]MCF0041743.1 DinB family protein [Dyadobacter fanqingshengii]MCF2505030.1 DinB family protein [Dyadobacter fanqingshengii]USJ36544.1 DinB family protein [Dyadobacter fanqingshengii]
MDETQRKKLVNELISLIEKGNAHVSFKDSVADLPSGLRTVIPENLPYSIWQLVEHIRIAQKDIVDFSASADSKSLAWPDDYWVEPTDAVSDDDWNNALKQIEEDQQRFQALLEEKQNDLFAPLPWGTGQSLLREAMLIADHNAYHTAEIVIARRLLKSWK